MPVVPEVTGADNVVDERAEEVEGEPAVLDVNINVEVEDNTEGDVVEVVAARFGDPVLRIIIMR
jgi:hypothetical protein